ncbi:MAG TPA: ABC transporter ATP-binding protein [Thermoanaerobaculia bacterium]|nr:ABC transporter ATP-binding protein [Thermoanaerobaculia bacterium]
MTGLLLAEALAAGYGASDVLSDVTRTFDAGRVTALLGENGAGKSTLLKALAGIVPARRGTVRLGGRLLSGIPRREAARALGYLPQGFEPLFPIRARDLVLLGRTPWRTAFGAPSARDHAAVEAALAEMDALALAETDLGAMSGGERQRVLLARVLAGEPRVLLLDEPAANLDPRHRFLVIDAMRRQADRGGTVVFSTHELDVASMGADDALLLSAGRVLAAGPLAETLTESLLSALFRVEACVAPGAGGRPIVSLGPARAR